MSGEKERGAAKVILLDRQELARLTDAWAIWAREATSPGRAVARARLHLFFLLARYGGLRSSEIRAFVEEAKFDSQSGLLQLKDRRLFLPTAALRPMRRILSLPEAGAKDFLRPDAGFLRRTFYEMAALSNLPPAACAPRALRYARAAELLAMHIPPQTVANTLGISSASQLARLFVHDNAPPAPLNSFSAVIAALETDYRAGRLILQTLCGLEFSAILPLDQLADIEAGAGKSVTAAVLPGLIFPSATPLPFANRLHCERLSLAVDGVETRLRLLAGGQIELLALLDMAICDIEYLRQNADLDVYIPAHAIRLGDV